MINANDAKTLSDANSTLTDRYDALLSQMYETIEANARSGKTEIKVDRSTLDNDAGQLVIDELIAQGYLVYKKVFRRYTISWKTPTLP